MTTTFGQLYYAGGDGDYYELVLYRLLCCSDTHGVTPPLLDERGAVAWLHAGDIVNGPTASDDASDPLNDPLRQEAAHWFVQRTLPVYAVRGNHDVTDDLGAFRVVDDVSGRITQIAPRLLVAGIGWHGERYYELPFESDVERLCESVSRMARRTVFASDRVILLTHYPPRFEGMADVPAEGIGVWYECVRKLVNELQPVAVIQGHVHRWFRTAFDAPLRHRSALVINPGPTGAILSVDIDEGVATHEWAAAGT